MAKHTSYLLVLSVSVLPLLLFDIAGLNRFPMTLSNGIDKNPKDAIFRVTRNVISVAAPKKAISTKEKTTPLFCCFISLSTSLSCLADSSTVKASFQRHILSRVSSSYLLNVSGDGSMPDHWYEYAAPTIDPSPASLSSDSLAFTKVSAACISSLLRELRTISPLISSFPEDFRGSASNSSSTALSPSEERRCCPDLAKSAWVPLGFSSFTAPLPPFGIFRPLVSHDDINTRLPRQLDRSRVRH